MVPIEDSARALRDTVTSVDKPVDAVVAVGGGARIPLVAAVLERWTNLPVVVPDEPEAVAARGAALLARPIPTSRRGARPAAARSAAPLASAPAGSNRRRRRELSGAGLAVGALVVIAVIGLGLGFGPKLVGGDSGEGSSATTVPAAPTTDAIAPIASSVPEPAPMPAPAPAPVEVQAPVCSRRRWCSRRRRRGMPPPSRPRHHPLRPRPRPRTGPRTQHHSPCRAYRRS